MTVYDRIKELADNRRKTISEIENDIGFSDNYIYSLKRKKPTSANLEKLADYFNVSVDYLLGRSNFYNDNEREKDYFFGRNVQPTHYDELSFYTNSSIKHLNKLLSPENIEDNEVLVNWLTGITTTYIELRYISKGLEQYDEFLKEALRLPVLKIDEENDKTENFDNILGAINRTAVSFNNIVDSKLHSSFGYKEFLQSLSDEENT
mgnify:CR=1 FL=1